MNFRSASLLALAVAGSVLTGVTACSKRDKTQPPPPFAPNIGPAAAPAAPAAPVPGAPVPSGTPGQSSATPPPQPSASNPPVQLDPTEQLVAPIALYPDPLLALLLPASTFSPQITAASEYLKGGGDPSQVDSQAWDPSVRGLAHYPDVVEWMAQNLPWTQALGQAFASNPNDVMQAIQRLRAIAKKDGTLADTPQQVVVDQDGAIAIDPAQPDEIYVPDYDPDVVFVENPYYGYGYPFITFGVGFPVGFWLGYGFDWHRHALWYGDWHNWYHNGSWAHPVYPGAHGYIAAPGARQWHAGASVHFEPAAGPSHESFHEAPAPREPAPHEYAPREGAPRPDFHPGYDRSVPRPERMQRRDDRGGGRDRHRDR